MLTDNGKLKKNRNLPTALIDFPPGIKLYTISQKEAPLE